MHKLDLHICLFFLMKAAAVNCAALSRLFEQHRGGKTRVDNQPGRKSMRSIARRSTLKTHSVWPSRSSLPARPSRKPKSEKPRSDLELLVEHVHGGGLGQQRGSAAVLLQAGQRHPVEGSLMGTWVG